MREKINRMSNKIVGIIGSRYFFWFIIALFIFQALWVALSFRYSMLYDEYYHFGIAQHFSHQWLPWIHDQPASLDQYGALVRSPYLLYHYLLSFPLRIVAFFTSNTNVQIIAMRVVNVGLFTGGLVVFERLFKVMNIKSVFRNITLLFFVLIPITPFLAATINYDNAVFLLLALFILVGVLIIKKHEVRWYQYAQMVLIGMTGSLMKVSFLPIFAAGIIYVFIRFAADHKRKFITVIQKSFNSSVLGVKVAVLVPLLLVGFVFVERFGINIVKYHSLSPSCETQIGVSRCDRGILNRRADQLAQQKTGKTPRQVPLYTSDWASSMLYSLMFTAANTGGMTGTRTAPPLPVAYIVVFFGAIALSAAFFYGLEKLRFIPGFWFIISVSALYVAALYYTDISTYYDYFEMIAVQGRYLVPFLPFIMVFGLIGMNYAMRNVGVLKLPILAVTLLLYMNGAGITTHIIRSDETWDWNNRTVRQINNGARAFLKPFIKERWY